MNIEKLLSKVKESSSNFKSTINFLTTLITIILPLMVGLLFFLAQTYPQANGYKIAAYSLTVANLILGIVYMKINSSSIPEIFELFKIYNEYKGMENSSAYYKQSALMKQNAIFNIDQLLTRLKVLDHNKQSTLTIDVELLKTTFNEVFENVFNDNLLDYFELSYSDYFSFGIYLKNFHDKSLECIYIYRSPELLKKKKNSPPRKFHKGIGNIGNSWLHNRTIIQSSMSTHYPNFTSDIDFEIYKSAIAVPIILNENEVLDGQIQSFISTEGDLPSFCGVVSISCGRENYFKENDTYLLRIFTYLVELYIQNNLIQNPSFKRFIHGVEYNQGDLNEEQK